MNRAKFMLPWAIMLLCFCSTTANAQQNPSIKFKLFFEKVFLHTDRSTYVAGDSVWYKAYLTDAQTGMLSYNSANLYVELIAPADTLVSRQIIQLKGGLGNGDFALPDSLPMGTYRLRAYTNWMRNFGNEFVFEHRITLLGNALPNKVSPSEIITPNIPRQPDAQPITNIPVGFYPEGGSLVNGINSLVTVKVEDNGRVSDFTTIKGSVYNSSGKPVATFQCDSLGIAQFNLQPQSGQLYKAAVTCGTAVFTVSLPTALNQGAALHLVINGNNVKAMISCTNILDTLTPRQLTLAGKHAGKTYFTEPVVLNGTKAEIDIPVEVLPAGVASLTLYDAGLHPQAERLIFIQPQYSPLTIHTDKPVYGPKDKVNVSLKVVDDEGKPAVSFLSLAAIDASTIDTNAGNIATYLLLQSELKGHINHPERYFDTANVNRQQQLDQLLLTQGWRNYLWRQLADTAIAITYAPENGFTLTGSLRQKFANKPLVNKKVVATLLQGRNDSHMYLALTDSAGKYRFDHLPVNGERNVELSALDDKQKNIGWLLVDSIKPDILPVKPLPQLKMGAQQQLITKAQTQIAQQRQAIRNSQAIRLKAVNVKGPRTANSPNYSANTYKPDQIFNITPKDHSYKTLQWFLLQNLKGALASNIDSVSGILVPGVVSILPGMPHSMLLSPVLSINGRENLYEESSAEADRKVIYDLPIQNVTKVVFKHLYGILFKPQKQTSVTLMHGDIYVLELTLKSGALKRPDVTKTSMEINGYYQAREFYKPVYNSLAKSNTPDYRSTVHWQPHVITDATGKAVISYYNADAKTTVKVIVQGITEKGIPVFGTASYAVK
ncbi:MG2 domain-containing protein [Mucilaginibacter terrae]|uniref:MG2 domain-containing protein n=1 Tax=Mucilaginibacter terrae TaxID=1955052 RepID=UPI00364479FE